MSEPANTPEPTPRPDVEREQPSRPEQLRPSDDDGPHAGASLDLPMSSPD
jgi:hypothetical protein